jgi:hypothetical protein
MMWLDIFTQNITMWPCFPAPGELWCQVAQPHGKPFPCPRASKIGNIFTVEFGAKNNDIDIDNNDNDNDT